MNPLIVFVLHSTLTKSVMGIMVIAKLTKWFFSLWLCTSHPRVCLAPFACTALSGPLFILSLPSSHNHSSQWLTLPSAVASRHIALEQRPSMWQSCKGGPWKDPASQDVPSKPMTCLYLCRGFFLLHPFLKLGNTPLFFYKSASHTEYIWSGKFFHFLPPHPRNESFCSALNVVLREGLWFLPPLHPVTMTPTLTTTLHPPPCSVPSFFLIPYFLFLYSEDFIFRHWFLVPLSLSTTRRKKLYSAKETWGKI